MRPRGASWNCQGDWNSVINFYKYITWRGSEWNRRSCHWTKVVVVVVFLPTLVYVMVPLLLLLLPSWGPSHVSDKSCRFSNLFIVCTITQSQPAPSKLGSRLQCLWSLWAYSNICHSVEASRHLDQKSSLNHVIRGWNSHRRAGGGGEMVQKLFKIWADGSTSFAWVQSAPSVRIFFGGFIYVDAGKLREYNILLFFFLL